MQLYRGVARMFALGAMVLGSGAVSGQDPSTGSGQDFPNRPIRMVTAGVGGGSDFVARIIAPAIAGPLGQQVIVDNRPAGVVQAEIVSRAPPDGHTLLVTGMTFWITPLLQSVPYDPVRDFSPVSLAERSINLVVVNPSLPVNSVKELIALAKAKPGQLNYATTATATGNHLAGELFNVMAGVNIVRVSYKSVGAALTELIAGQVQLMFASVASAMPQVKSGRLKVLAVTSPQPSALAPGWPTVAASGLPGYESVTLTAIFATAKTPTAIINRLNQEIVRALNTADVKEKYLNVGTEPISSSPAELAAAMKSEMARMGKVIKDAGIKIE